MILTKEEFNAIRYFFSLALEDYIGDIKELEEMADVTKENIDKFLKEEKLQTKTIYKYYPYLTRQLKNKKAVN